MKSKTTKKEKKLEKYLLPDKYLKENSPKQPEYLFWYLQNQAHEILNSFLNGGLSKRAYILFPILDELSNEIKQKIKLVKKAANALLNQGHNFVLTVDSCTTNPTPAECAQLLSSLYQDLESIQKKGAKKETKPKVKQLQFSKYKKTDSNIVAALRKIKNFADKNLKKHTTEFYLQGSLATRDYIKGWSDCDTLTIVRKETINNPKKLLDLRKKLYKLRKYFFEIDPLQHHGTIIIAEYELSNYPHAYFPLPVLKYAKSFFPNKKETIRTRKSEKESLQYLYWFVLYFRKLNGRKKLDSYEIKNVLHALTLLPTLYLQTKKVYIYKKFSFEKAKKDFRKEEWEIIEIVSKMRKKWKPYKTVIGIKAYAHLNPIAAYQINYRMIDLFFPVEEQNEINGGELVKDVHNLYETTWKKVLKNVKV